MDWKSSKDNLKPERDPDLTLDIGFKKLNVFVCFWWKEKRQWNSNDCCFYKIDIEHECWLDDSLSSDDWQLYETTGWYANYRTAILNSYYSYVLEQSFFKEDRP